MYNNIDDRIMSTKKKKIQSHIIIFYFSFEIVDKNIFKFYYSILQYCKTYFIEKTIVESLYINTIHVSL